MRMNKSALVLTGGIVILALLGGGAAIAWAQASATAGAPSDGPVYIYDTDGRPVSDTDVVWKYDSEIYGVGSPTDVNAPIVCPADSSGVSFFMSPIGHERAPSGWSAWADAMFPRGSKDVLMAALSPAGFIAGNARQAIAAGGRYSLGFVCTSNNGVTVDKAYYRTIDMTGGSGDFTVEKQ
jgi:hypothetical protein